MTRALATAAMALILTAITGAQSPSGSVPKIPVREGLTIVTAVNNGDADYESIKRLTHIDGATVRVAYSTDMPLDQAADPLAGLLTGNCQPKAGGDPKKPSVQGSVVRVVRRADLESAHQYRPWFNICSTGEEYPGSTAVGVSSAVLRELNEKGETRLSIPLNGAGGSLANLIGSVLGETPDSAGDEGSVPSGVLRRVERGTVPLQVLVNDEPVQLQAVHVRGQIGDDPAEFWFLDDVANPLSLRWSMGEGGKKLQVVKLSFPPEAPTTGGKPETSTAATPAAPARIEHELATEGRAIVYGIYFDFASDRIKAESEPVLAEIAGVMNHNPTWSLSLEGHTDSIGGATSNLDLSKRRAAAVKQALTSRFKIAASRLQTNGYGASRPKDTNATLEGRARNRRVELVKI